MTKSHTPGPWVWDKNPLTANTFNILSDGIRLAEVVSGPAEFTKPVYGCPEYIGTQGEANARLIAAAPELLEALDQIINPTLINGDKEISVTWETLAYGEKVIRWETAKKAIAKAKGETK